MGSEMCIRDSIETVQVGEHFWENNHYLVRSSLSGADIFRAKELQENYVSERAKQWLEKNVPKWVRFEKALIDS